MKEDYLKQHSEWEKTVTYSRNYSKEKTVDFTKERNYQTPQLGLCGIRVQIIVNYIQILTKEWLLQNGSTRAIKHTPWTIVHLKPVHNLTIAQCCRTEMNKQTDRWDSELSIKSRQILSHSLNTLNAKIENAIKCCVMPPV